MNGARKTVLAGGVVGVLVAAVAIFAMQALGAKDSSSEDPSGSVAASFGVLRNSAVAPAPDSAKAEFESLHPGSYADAKTARPGFYVADWSGAICVVIANGMSGCSDVLDNGVWFHSHEVRSSDDSQAPFDFYIYGVADDDVRAIQVVDQSGTSKTFDVTNNAFYGEWLGAGFAQIASVNAVTSAGTLALQTHFPDLAKRPFRHS